jgi:hypothetical protein
VTGAELDQRQQGEVVAHGLADRRLPGDRHLCRRRERMAQRHADWRLWQVARRPRDESPLRRALVGEDRIATGPDQVDTGLAIADTEQEEAELAGVVPAPLRRRRAGEDLAEPRPRERGRGHQVRPCLPDPVEEGEMRMPREHHADVMRADQLQQPAPRGLVDVVVVAEPLFLVRHQERREMHEHEDRRSGMRREVALQPARLLGGLGQRPVHDLRVQHDEVAAGVIPAVPGPAEALVVRPHGLRGRPIGGHGGIRLVAHIVVAGDLARRHTGVPHLRQRLAERFLEPGALGELLHQVAEMHHERRLQRSHQPVSVGGPRRLTPPRLELHPLRAGIEHVVRIRHHHQLEIGRREEGTVEHCAHLSRHRRRACHRVPTRMRRGRVAGGS